MQARSTRQDGVYSEVARRPLELKSDWWVKNVTLLTLDRKSRREPRSMDSELKL